MIQVKKILFPTDFSRRGNRALAHSLRLAKKYQAELHMLHTWYYGMMTLIIQPIIFRTKKSCAHG